MEAASTGFAVMKKAWSAIIIAVTGGFILVAAARQDIRTPNAVIWEPVTAAEQGFDRAPGLVLQHAEDGVFWASDGFSIYRSFDHRGFLKVSDVMPPLGPAWGAYSRTLRGWFGIEETIEVFPLSSTMLLVFVGGEIRRIDLKDGNTEAVHRLRDHGRGEGRGVMPFGVTADSDGHIYYGESVKRPLLEGETIALFRSDKNGRNFEIVYEFPAAAIRHIQAVQWDPHGQALWMATGDSDEQSRIGYSEDFGKTFTWIGEGSQAFRTANLRFSEDHVDWLSDTGEIPSRAFRWNRESREIKSSPQPLPGHGRYIQRIGEGFSLGTTAEEVASLWLIGPELDLEPLMEWTLGEAKTRGHGTIRLARGRPESDSWLYFSPLRVRDRQPAIYRLSKQIAFAAADRSSKHRLVSRDDP